LRSPRILNQKITLRGFNPRYNTNATRPLKSNASCVSSLYLLFKVLLYNKKSRGARRCEHYFLWNLGMSGEAVRVVIADDDKSIRDLMSDFLARRRF